MYKNLINKHLSNRLLNEEGKHNGLATTEKVQKDEKKVNKDYYKEVEKKMKDYDGSLTQEDENAIEAPKTNVEGETKDYHDEMEIRNGQEMLKYDNEPSERFKERAEMALAGDSKMGNKTYTGVDNGNTEEVWGASGGKNTGEEIVKQVKASTKKRNDAEANLVQFGDDIEQSGKKNTRGKARKVAVENVINNNEPLNETKMKKKRLRFKKAFDGLGNALQLIPENYKVDSKEFEMTDGNETYDIRWEGSLTEGKAVVLMAADSNMVNEDIQKMKHLMGYSSESTLGNLKGEERLTENKDNSFRAMLDRTRGLMTESVEEVTETEEVTEQEVDENHSAKIAKAKAAWDEENSEVTESEEVNEMENIEGQTAPKGDWDDAKGPKGDNHADHIMEEDEVTENEEVTEAEEVNEDEDIQEGEKKKDNLEEGEEILESLIDEGWRDFLGMEKGDVVNDRRAEFEAIIDKAEAKGMKVNRESLMRQGEENKFRGKLLPIKGMLIYKAGASGLGKMAAGSGSQTAGM